jgi:predicted nucleic acid-binding protein
LAAGFRLRQGCGGQLPGRTIALARKHGLTIYDAACLEFAQRRGAILATFDTQLLKAAAK